MQGARRFSRTCRWLGAWLSVIVAGVFPLAARASTITVTTTNLNGAGSLAQAITTANANPGEDTIIFQISGTPPFTIKPTNALPALTDPVVIDATTQPGFNVTNRKPVIEINGASAGGSTIGLRFTVGGSTLRGVAINRYQVQALELDGVSNVIQGNFIGTDVTGTNAHGNGSSSYPAILVNSAGNLIGGTNSGDGNVISGGNGDGIYVFGGNNNIFQGNLIGVAAAGTAPLGNAKNGIVLYSSGGNLIGGAVPAARNVISGNGNSGVFLTGGGSAGNVIQGNFIGTDISGSNAVGNVAGDGITLVGAPANLIASNLISGNGLAGVSLQNGGASGNQLTGNWIGPNISGTTSLANQDSGVVIVGAGGNRIGGTNAGAGNVISGNKLDGVTLTGGASANVIQGNVIGLNAAGTQALRNRQNGITTSGATGNTIGGLVAGARNVISGNAGNGIDIFQLTDGGNTVLGNYIGTDLNGTQAIANNLAGVLLQGSSNLIGGTVSGARNIISGNLYQGIWIVGSAGNVIQGNFIGLTPAGTAGLGNGITTSDSGGIGISTASGNLIGGTAPGAGNVISANNGAGIWMAGTTATGNVVQGNFLGTDVTGASGVGNTWEGIYLEQAVANQIGGTAAGAGNLISGNYTDGIFLNGAVGNLIQGNLVGTKTDGSNNLANYYHNVELQTGANNNTIGGTAPGAGNTLAHASMNGSKLYCGVRVRTGAANNLISGNSIFGNGGLGIDLSPTDALSNNPGPNAIVSCEDGVAAAAANSGQNFPVLAGVCSGATTRVSGSLNSKSGGHYTLQFFANPVGAAAGYGQGQMFLGETNVDLAAACAAGFTAYFPFNVPPGWVVSATAADANHNTSEFSAWVPVTALPALQLNQTSPGQLAISWTNNGGSFALQQAFSLTPPIAWQPVNALPVLQDNFQVTTVGLTGSNAFYRLVAP